jgi:hypothetical protein
MKVRGRLKQLSNTACGGFANIWSSLGIVGLGESEFARNEQYQ